MSFLHRLLLPLLVLTPVAHSLAQGSSSSDTNLLVRLRMYALPVAEADALLARPELKTHAASALKWLERQVAEKKAEVRGNPSVLLQPGTRTMIEGRTRVEIDSSEAGAGALRLLLGADHAGATLRSEVTLAAGSSVFAGSMNLPPEPGRASQKCLVFITVQ